MNWLSHLSVPATIAAALAACATLPPPTEQLAAARAAIESADVAGAAKNAPLELNQARDKLTAAQLAARDNDREKARRLADEALVDAQLAQAKAASANSRDGLAQADAAVRALRNEAGRTPDTTSPATVMPVPAAPPVR